MRLGGNVMHFIPDPAAELAEQMNILKQRTVETSNELRNLEQEQQAYTITYHDSTKISG